jgi:hypothetical protein
MFCTAAGDRPYKTPFSLVAVRTSDFVSSEECNAEPVASFYYELLVIIMIHVYQRICCVTLCGWCWPIAMKKIFSIEVILKQTERRFAWFNTNHC